jgi:hypothetical protein
VYLITPYDDAVGHPLLMRSHMEGNPPSRMRVYTKSSKREGHLDPACRQERGAWLHFSLGAIVVEVSHAVAEYFRSRSHPDAMLKLLQADSAQCCAHTAEFDHSQEAI